MTQLTQKTENASKRNTKKEFTGRSRNWFLTLNNYTEDDITEILSTFPSKIAMQEEKGKNGTKHLQGILCYSNARRGKKMTELCGGRIHWEIPRNIYACKNYCQKIETSNGKKWYYGWDKKLKPKPIFGNDDCVVCKKGYLAPWCKDVVDLIERCKADDRKIYWIWSKDGKKGKTALAKHILHKIGGLSIGGASKDCFYGINQYVEKNKKSPPVIMFNLPRNSQDKLSYSALEQVKDGLFYSPKYESSMTLYPCTWMFVFANYEPDTKKCSIDRWEIINVD